MIRKLGYYNEKMERRFQDIFHYVEIYKQNDSELKHLLFKLKAAVKKAMEEKESEMWENERLGGYT